MVASLAVVGLTVGTGASSPMPPTRRARHQPAAPRRRGEPIRLGILAECEGAFGGFNEDVVAGVTLAMVNQAGATSNSTTTALDGFTGAVAGGRPIEVVGIGCGDDTPDRIIQEVRTLVEQDDAEIVIGPLSGDEAIAVANYAKDHPDVTFIDGIAGSQEPTLQVQAPNYFRFHGDGAQWNAGLGDILYNEAGWRTVAVIADDYSFGWTSAAGFIADFCAVGGEVVARVFPPLGTTDYSSFIQQLPDPDEVDGYFWVVGGTGTQAALEAFVNSKGDLTGDQHAGNLFFNPSLATALGPDIAGAYVGGFAAFPGDVHTPAIDEYLASADAAWDTLVGGITGGEAGGAVAVGRVRLLLRLLRRPAWRWSRRSNAVDGDLSDGHAALREALSTMTLEAPYGNVTLDENRQGIIDTYVAQLVLDEESGEVVQKTVAIIPQVDQTFGGTFGPDTPPPSRDFPGCETRDLPWSGNAIPVVDGVPQTEGATVRRHRRRRHEAAGTEADGSGDHRRGMNARGDDDGRSGAAEGVAPLVQLRDVVVAFGGLLALGGVDLDVARGERLAVLGPNGAGKTTLFNVIAGDLHPTAGTVTINGVDCTRRRRDAGPASGWPARTRRRGCSSGSPSRTTSSWPGPASTAVTARSTGAGCAAPCRDAAARAARGGVARRSARHGGRRPVPRPAAPARGGHGRGHRARR